MEKSRSTIHPIELIICAAVFAALCFLFGSTLWLSPLMAMPVIYVWTKMGHSAGAIMTAAAAAVMIAMHGSLAPVVLALSIPSMIAAGVALRRRLSGFYTVVISAAAIFAGMAAIAVYVSATSGSDIAGYASERLLAAAETDDTYAAAAFMASAATDVVTGSMSYEKLLETMMSMDAIRSYLATEAAQAAVNTYFTQLVSAVVSSVPVYCGLLNVVIPRAAAKKRGARVSYMPGFDRFILPKKVSMYFVVTFLLSMIPILFEVESLMVAAQTLYLAVSAVFTIQGLSLLYYFLGRKIDSRALRIFLLAVIYIACAIFGFDVFVWMGMIEQLFRIREGIAAAGGNGGA